MSSSYISAKSLKHYYTPVFIVCMVAVIISTLTRISLAVYSASGIDWSLLNIAGIVGIGLFYDLVIASYVMIPLVLHLWGINEGIYTARRRIIAIVAGLLLLGILIFTDLVPKDFNEDLRKFVIIYVMVRLLIYISLSFAGERFRMGWRKWVLMIDMFIITYLLLFNAVSEWFFWNEFSARYNFIAVDYLVYTSEVAGNIWESYPVGWLLTGVFVLAVSTLWLLRKPVMRSLEYRPGLFKRSYSSVALLLLPLASYLIVGNSLRKFSDNEYVNELAGNGMFEFGTAFWNNELDYFKFYRTLPDKEAFTILRKELSAPNAHFTSNDVFDIERSITPAEPEKKMNVVLISVESLSADFMKSFGNTGNITPQLDSLATESMLFTNLYSSGTRTVRGLEALSLAIPPTPGQSIVKRPDNEHLFSLGSVFKSKGYSTQYIYGGYGYFDNMNYFFSNNGYTVIDRDALLPAQIHYANIWGVADEDLFTLTLQKVDQEYAKGKNFFTHVMTVSNHRPFTYPDGRINIPPSTQTREGAVKYTDYAIGKFLREAKSKSWFSNTIFVIVADHCAGSAGSVQLPVTGYHIPMIIYSPGNISAQKVNKLTAQIDIAPTILGLLHFNYKSKFFGQDIFTEAPGNEKAFISTYQGLGYIKANKLVILSPVRKQTEFEPDFKTGKATSVALTDSLSKQAIAYYQCASWLIKNKKYTGSY
ncbi:Phosphoglycerol transferase MdoB [Chitinophaga sp. CF118]|uniref:LTA synthase family protein n=1 Tax=Chitinophaga sp. CF118 TaxID=1884367 RepID=UPI0008E0938E|nr:LTA synthase family protein [Chitinophaga sp. CF118]SFD46909.1 Phosphoglycerol transferase MdoB [Chitinophaga sp. CF118]